MNPTQSTQTYLGALADGRNLGPLAANHNDLKHINNQSYAENHLSDQSNGPSNETRLLTRRFGENGVLDVHVARILFPTHKPLRQSVWKLLA